MEREKEGDGDRPAVLIVDDEPTNLQRLAGVLGDAYRVLVAPSGERALEIVARKRRPDAILLDIVMPGMDGYEVLERLQAEPGTREIPVIFITGRSEQEAEAHGLALGAVDYITKPFNSAVVRARVGTHVALKRRSDQLAASYRQLQERQRALADELAVAARIHGTLLPEERPALPGCDLAWSYQPSAELGGDALSAVPLADGRVALYILDVSGHGLASALVSFAAAQSIRQWIAERADVSPAAVMAALDAQFPLERFGKLLTAIFLVYDPDRGELRYCNAGHPPGVLVAERGGSVALEAGGLPIGVGTWGTYEEGVVRLADGDLLFLYTDGLVELEDAAGTPLSIPGLEAALRDWRGAAPETVVGGVERMMARHTDAAPEDDVAFACLRVQAQGAGEREGRPVVEGTAHSVERRLQR